MSTETYILENNLSAAVRGELEHACTKMWHPDTRARASARAINDVVFKRHDNTVRYAIPWISKHIDISRTRIIDFGCGCGSSSLAFSHFSEHVTGLEIDSEYVRAFKDRMQIMGASNCICVQTTPEQILEALAECINERSSIIFLAVIEHLTEAEQVEYLRRAWQLLAPGQIIAVIETPNRLSLFDDHTFEKSFAHLVPDELFVDWIDSQPVETRFRHVLKDLAETVGTAEALLRRRRLGLGVAPQVFEMALEEPIEEVLVADSFDQLMVDWFPPTKCDELLLDYWAHYKPSLPFGFARSVLGLIFRKPHSEVDREKARAWNKRNNEHIEQKHAAAKGAYVNELLAALHHAEKLALERWDIMSQMEAIIRQKDSLICKLQQHA